MQDHRKIKNGEDPEHSKIREWRELLSQRTALSDGRPIPVFLFLNKADLPVGEKVIMSP